MKLSVHWLKDFVPISPPFERIAERLTMAGLEVKKVEGDGKDTVFEIEITSNRPDWLSHLGVAREISAVENLSLKQFSREDKSTRPLPKGWKIHLKEPRGCPFYTGVYIEGISHAPTPDFMRERLRACGIRSINFFVDVTNYVLLETGQPLHAFDADLISGQEIVIRQARDQEQFTALSGTQLALNSQDLLIADKEKAIALAGVMGGKNSEVSPSTRNLFMESAFFTPRWIRQTSLRTGLRSDSSYRFERRVDPEMVETARERAIDLIRQYAHPRFISGVLRAGQTPDTVKTRIHLSNAEIHKQLGVEIKPYQVSHILARLGLEVKNDAQDSWNVGVPSFRSDLTRTIDLIEEIARIHGYDQIPESLPTAQLIARSDTPFQKAINTARIFFPGAGYYETVTFSLIPGTGLSPEESDSAVRIINPQNKELNLMRPSFLPSFLSVIEKNIRQASHDLAFFEIANLYRQNPSTSQPTEEKYLGLCLHGAKSKSWLDPLRPYTFYDLKGSIEQFLSHLKIRDLKFVPGSASSFNPNIQELIEINGRSIGLIGEVAPSILKHWDIDAQVYYAQISIKQLTANGITPAFFHEMPKYPSIKRDLALVVPKEVKSEEVIQAILKAGGDLVVHAEIFDIFQGGRIPKGFKNLAYRLTYQSSQQTLISEEIQTLHTSIAEKLKDRFKAQFQ